VTRLNLNPYRAGDDPPQGSVAVSVIVLTRDEEPNIRRCLTSVAWADQVVVVDSGSSDETVLISKSLGADVVDQPWLGYAAQRERALGLELIRNDWAYFVDADEWVSPQLASEIALLLAAPSCAGFAQHLRLVFQGTWIRHCGWYSASLVVRLVDRRYTSYNGQIVGERACVDGMVGRLRNDIVDEDLKGLAIWLHKHVRYAQLQAERRGRPVPPAERLRRIRHRDRTDTRPLVRVVLKDVIFPSIPARPLALFVYMYLIRLGFLDGLAGLRFCFYHAWYEASIAALQADATPQQRASDGHR
jgi:glycosyltransferase involved in cell wall biosynthesis